MCMYVYVYVYVFVCMCMYMTILIPSAATGKDVLFSLQAITSLLESGAAAQRRPS